MRYRNPYQTRHTFASTLLMNGEPELLVAKLLACMAPSCQPRAAAAAMARTMNRMRQGAGMMLVSIQTPMK